MSSSRSIAAARSRHTIDQPPRPPPPQQSLSHSQGKQNTFASEVQTKISVQDAINIVTRRITRLEQLPSSQQLQVPENSCIVDNAVLDDIISRLYKLESTQEETLDSFRREFESKIETLTKETNEKLVDIDLAFAEIEKSIQIDQDANNNETSSANISDISDISETIKLDISST